MPCSSPETPSVERAAGAWKPSNGANRITLQGVDAMTANPILTERQLNSLERRVKGWEYPQLTHDEAAEIIISLTGTVRRQQSEINTLLSELTELRKTK